jgi:hypothetical protein
VRSAVRLNSIAQADACAPHPDIIESRLTRLSYAPEIAQAMLCQQQASAVIGAR